MGLFGVMYGRTIADVVEVKLYTGIRQGLVLSGGVGLKLFSNDYLEVVPSIDYSFCFGGDLTYEEGNDVTDGYRVGLGQFVNTYLCARYFPKEDWGFQLGLGYSNAIKEPSINHRYGPNENYSSVKRFSGSGFLFEIGVLFLIGN